jgi:hypothetical protein
VVVCTYKSVTQETETGGPSVQGLDYLEGLCQRKKWKGGRKGRREEVKERKEEREQRKEEEMRMEGISVGTHTGA